MKSGGVFRLVAMGLGIFWWSLTGGLGEEKFIRLRNEVIATEAPAPKVANVTSYFSEAPVSGLYLLQFVTRMEPAWRDQLEGEGVKFLRYVPEDAFVVRLSRGRIGRLRSWPFVQWIGPYRPQHKKHPSLPDAWNALGPVPPAGRSIRVLLASDATPLEAAPLRRLFQKFDRENATRLGAILQGAATPAQVDALAASPAVLWLEPVPQMKLFDEIAAKITGGNDGTNGTFPLTQQLGFDGSGVTVAVADSGLDSGEAATMHPDLAGRVDAFFHYGALPDAADEHSHGTHVAGIVAGNASLGETDAEGFLYGMGTAPGAHLIAQRIFDGVGGYEPPASHEVLTHDAVRAGAEIGSNSWGEDTQGRYDLSAAEFDALVRDADAGTPGDQPYILEFSAGNAGPGEQTIGSPAVAKNVIATGAAENNRFDLFIYDSGQETMADFSSRGPCEDGRIKPDVVAPGTWIGSLRSVHADDANAWLEISENYLYQGGTSQAGPAVSGAAAVFVQYYRETMGNATPSPALVKAALINCAVDMDPLGGTAPVPNNDEGWGRVDLSEMIGADRRFDFVEQSALLLSGSVFERRVVIASAEAPLKITLAYTDEPGLPAAIPALVNDLDLEVLAPNGAVLHGNQWVEGESVPNAVAFDRINNVEAVHLRAPVPGEYIIRVHGANVVEDARRDTPAVDQDFALVISGDIPLPGVGFLFFDRDSYTVPGQIKLKLVDFDLAGQPSAAVLLKSTTETNGENLVLLSAGAAGVFTGSVATATGGANSDGFLQIAHHDDIEAVYQDTAPTGQRRAQARADLWPPVITNVFVTNRFGQMVISWQTDEPATDVVRLGTNMNLSLAGTNAGLRTQHEIGFSGLGAGTNYFFYVVSTDGAGNTATNDNGGNLFSFVAQPTATALLVDAYVPTEFDTAIPRSAYTNALEQTGVSYEVWEVSQRGSPVFEDLRPFPVVIWRINDSLLGDASLTAAQQSVLTTYFTNGGAIFFSSMEFLTRLGTSPSALAFRTNVLQVRSFVEDNQMDGVLLGVPAAYGVESEPISSGMGLLLDYESYNNEFLELLGVSPNVADTLTLTTNASPIFLDDFDLVAGLRFPRIGQDSAGRIIFLSFPFDAISETDPAPDNRANFLRNALSFLAPGVNGISTLALDKPFYRLPSLITVEVADSDLAGWGQTVVTFFSDTATNGQTVTLLETPRRGLFRGYLTLVAATNSFQTGELRAQQGDSVWVEYFDVSANGVGRALAVVDTAPPELTNVSTEPEYEEATVIWTTSKPTDGLVQFGESSFLGRTAYDETFSTSHAVKLTGLQPDRDYLFQVVSRDQAGNTATDNDQGAFYHFRTLRPFSLPWLDDLENSLTNWTVLDGSLSETTWQLGRPSTSTATNALSGTNCWGSNLHGDFIDAGDTTLASPAIDLTGGAGATLRFWYNYDFTPFSEADIYEFGQVHITTNNGQVWTPLAEFGDFSFGWEEAEIDLSAYQGRVIRVGFYYGLFSLDTANRPGWLIDDVSITTGGLANGFLEISNNLAQARFNVTGPVSASGAGWNTVISNAPPGEYMVTFAAVPFYTTPAPQTNVLAGSRLLFSGNYTFADANTNGIADAWEQHFFGGVDGGRTAFTDSDGDGRSDYAEFMSGTIPTNANSTLRLTPAWQTNQTLQIAWPSVVDRAYQLQSSADAVNWAAASAWLVATNTNSAFIAPPPANGAPYLFRLQVRP